MRLVNIIFIEKKTEMVKRFIGILIFMLCLATGTIKAEKRGTWSGDASAAIANTDLYFSYSFNYNLWLNNYISVYLGGLFTHSYSDNGGDWKGASGSTYYFPDRLKTRHLNAQVGILFYTPSVLKTGLYGGGHAFCDLIPFNIVSVKKVVGREGIYETTEDINKFRFNKFSPGAFVEVGLYHDFHSKKNPDSAIRLSLGYGYGYYDPFSAYRDTKIDDIRIGDKMSSNDHRYHQITVRITGLLDL